LSLNARGNNGPLIAAGGGVLLFISLFLDWFEGTSAFKLFDIVDIILALLALTAIAIGAMLATGNTTNLPAAPGAIVTTAAIIAFTIVATFVLEGDDHKFGIFLSLIGTIAMVVGGMQLAAGGAPTEPRTRVAEPTSPPPPPPPSTGGGAGPGASV
jgi:drug/metabolite transporter (DMT)-like permease